jgi:hypothetical protein
MFSESFERRFGKSGWQIRCFCGQVVVACLANYGHVTLGKAWLKHNNRLQSFR